MALFFAFAAASPATASIGPILGAVPDGGPVTVAKGQPRSAHGLQPLISCRSPHPIRLAT